MTNDNTEPKQNKNQYMDSYNPTNRYRKMNYVDDTGINTLEVSREVNNY